MTITPTETSHPQAEALGLSVRTAAEILCPVCSSPRPRTQVLYGSLVCRGCWAGFVNRRQGAFLLDCLLFAAIGVSLYRMLAWAGLRRELAWLVYLAFAFKDGSQGMSPAKWLLGLQVVDRESLEPAGFAASLKRNLSVSIPYVGWLFALVIGLTLNRGSRWGDGWARTKVIWRKHAHRVPFDTRGFCCQQCGYDLTGNVSGVCPECGVHVPPPGQSAEASMPACCPCCGKRREFWEYALVYGSTRCISCLRSLVRRREGAFLVDAGFLAMVWFLAAAIWNLKVGDFWFAPTHAWGLAMMFAFALKDSIRGTSLGRSIFGIQVVRASSCRPAGLISALIRNLSWFWPIPFMTWLGSVVQDRDTLRSMVSMLWVLVAFSLAAGTQGFMKGQRAADRWAGTWVLRATDAKRLRDHTEK